MKLEIQAIHIHVHQRLDSEARVMLASILNAVQQLGVLMSAELDALKTKVENNGGVIGSAIALLNGLAQQIRDNAQDPTALHALADSLDAQDASLANAIQANTPGAAGAGTTVNPDGSGRPIPGSTNPDGTINP